MGGRVRFERMCVGTYSLCVGFCSRYGDFYGRSVVCYIICVGGVGAMWSVTASMWSVTGAMGDVIASM